VSNCRLRDVECLASAPAKHLTVERAATAAAPFEVLGRWQRPGDLLPTSSRAFRLGWEAREEWK